MDVKPGYTTTEFWITLLGNVAAASTLLFHKTFNWDVQAVAGGAAIVGNAVYSLARSRVKSAAHFASRPQVPKVA